MFFRTRMYSAVVYYLRTKAIEVEMGPSVMTYKDVKIYLSEPGSSIKLAGCRFGPNIINIHETPGLFCNIVYDKRIPLDDAHLSAFMPLVAKFIKVFRHLQGYGFLQVVKCSHEKYLTVIESILGSDYVKNGDCEVLHIFGECDEVILYDANVGDKLEIFHYMDGAKPIPPFGNWGADSEVVFLE